MSDASPSVLCFPVVLLHLTRLSLSLIFTRCRRHDERNDTRRLLLTFLVRHLLRRIDGTLALVEKARSVNVNEWNITTLSHGCLSTQRKRWSWSAWPWSSTRHRSKGVVSSPTASTVTLSSTGRRRLTMPRCLDASDASDSRFRRVVGRGLWVSVSWLQPSGHHQLVFRRCDSRKKWRECLSQDQTMDQHLEAPRRKTRIRGIEASRHRGIARLAASVVHRSHSFVLWRAVVGAEGDAWQNSRLR